MNTQQGSTPFSCLTLNMGGPGRADDRRDEARSVIEQQQPDIVFAQEIVSLKMWKVRTYLPGYNFSANGFEAGVFSREEVFEEEQSYIIDPSQENGLASKYHFHFNPSYCNRLYAVTLKHLHNGVRVLCVSWHGPHNGVNVQQRAQILKELIKLVTALSIEHKVHDVILGGDYNLSTEWALWVLAELKNEANKMLAGFLEMTTVELYKALRDRPWVLMCPPQQSTVKSVDNAPRIKQSIDYFLVCGSVAPQDNVVACTLMEQVKALDHRSVMARFQLAAPVAQIQQVVQPDMHTLTSQFGNVRI